MRKTKSRENEFYKYKSKIVNIRFLIRLGPFVVLIKDITVPITLNGSMQIHPTNTHNNKSNDTEIKRRRGKRKKWEKGSEFRVRTEQDRSKGC